MKINRARFLTLVLSLLAVTWAIAQNVQYNFDKEADFSKYKTYKWVHLKDVAQLDELTEKQLVAALDAELARKGLSKTEADTADLYVGYQVAIKEERQFTTYSTGWGYGPGWRAGMGSTTTYGETSTIHIGELVMDMYDAGKHDLVWRGVATKTLDPKAKPEKRQKNIEKAVAKLLKNYPPEKKK